MARIQLGRYSRFLVTGDRGWPRDGYQIIKNALEDLPNNPLIITDDSQGVAQQADIAASILNYRAIVVKQEEEKYGQYAPLVRNLRMFEQYRPHTMLAFLVHDGDTRGIKHSLMLAEKRGVPIQTFSYDKLVHLAAARRTAN